MLTRSDALQKVLGTAIYADDIKLDRMLYAKQVYSNHAHARILSIDASAAKQWPGVVDVVTATEVPGLKKVGEVIKDHAILAFEKVRYHGDVLAVVAALDYETACQAAQSVVVSYEPLQAVFDPIEALEPNAPKIHEDRENNIVASYKARCGKMPWSDEDAHVLGSSDESSLKTFETSFKTQCIEHAYLEPESCVAVPNPDGTVTVHAGTQHPFSTRRFVAAFLGLTLNKVRICQTTLGGGFGGKDDTISFLCARTALLAIRTARPVKLTLTREESIRESYKRHPFAIKLKMAVDSEGKIQALDSCFVADGGAYCSISPFVILRPTLQCTGPYKIPHVHCDSMAVYTNNTFSGAMRGFGTPQYNFALESFMDMVAHELGRDPVAFRFANFFTQGDKTHTGQALTGHKVSIAQVVTETLKAFDWETKYKNGSRGQISTENTFYGVGLACSYRGVSLGAEGADFSSAIVNVQPDGSVLLETGVSENGQGSKTAMTRVLGIELGIDPAQIVFLDTDTSAIADGGSTVASRGTLVGGNAVIDAAKQIKNLMMPVIDKLLGKSKEGFVFSKNRIVNPHTKKEISFGEAVKTCHKERVYLYALGTWRSPKLGWNEHTGKGDAYFTFVYGCNAVEIEVDAKTGRVRVLSAVGTHDVGRAINTQMLTGQIHGGMVMGMGQALSEEIIHKNGQIQNTNLNTYKIPRATDVPQMKAIIIENPDAAGPFGAKSIGEPANELMAGAIANAVFNATGVRVRELPVRGNELTSSRAHDGRKEVLGACVSV